MTSLLWAPKMTMLIVACFTALEAVAMTSFVLLIDKSLSVVFWASVVGAGLALWTHELWQRRGPAVADSSRIQHIGMSFWDFWGKQKKSVPFPCPDIDGQQPSISNVFTVIRGPSPLGDRGQEGFCLPRTREKGARLDERTVTSSFNAPTGSRCGDKGVHLLARVRRRAAKTIVFFRRTDDRIQPCAALSGAGSTGGHYEIKF
jgi:hypothetical protein